MTLALTETSGTYQLDAVETEASYQNGQFIINGTKLFVTDAHVSDLLILVARTQKPTEREDGLTLFLVPSNTKGITITPHHSIASDKQSEITLENVLVHSDAIIGSKNMGGEMLARALERGAIAKCMEMIGGAEAVLDMTVEYTKQRTQFGQPIGSFQAVQHHCANMAIDVDASRLIAYQAAWKLSEGLPAAREVSMAKAWVSNAYLRICALANLCHGAISFTKEHDLQLYTRRARVQEQSMGDSTFHLKLLDQGHNT
jgi:alkylation response protein AidB-like acyl-CoA dehydrogenase